MPKRKLSSEADENDHNSINTQKMAQPFKKKAVNETERKGQQQKALAALSRFLSVSEKYSKAWEEQRKNILNSKQFEEENNYFNGSLREYQLIGVKWMETLYLSGINGILADEMGLGKTVQIIAFLAKLQTKGVKGFHMISVPLSTVPNWISEFKRFAPKFPVISFAGLKADRETAKKELVKASLAPAKTTEIYPIVIVPHHHMVTFVNECERMKFIYLIIDEGHRIKNHESQMSICARKISCRNKLLLTGTPLQNNMIELWSLLNFIMPAIFSNMEIFNQLIQADDLANETVISTNLKESTNIVSTLQRILEPFMLRRLKSNVLTEKLPMKSVRIYCEMTPEQLMLYTAALQKDIATMRGEKDDDVILERKKRKTRSNISYANDSVKIFIEPKPEKELPTHMHWTSMNNPFMMYRRIVNHPHLVNAPLIPGTPNILIDERLVTYSGKMSVLDTMLKKLLERRHKVIIFSTLVIMIDLIEDLMHYRNIEYARLTGTDNLEARAREIERFSTDPNVGVFLVSTRAGGQGINLTAADTVIFYDSDWNPHADLQAQARCHRIGQTRPVVVYTLISKNSIDEYILRCGELKLRLEMAIMSDERRQRLNVTTLEELLDFLKKKEGSVESDGPGLSEKQLDALLDRSELEKEFAETKDVDSK